MQNLEKRVLRLLAWRSPVCALLVLGVLVGGCQRSAVTPKEGSSGDVTTPSTGGIKPGPKPFEATGGIDPKVISAWEKAGARFGWEVPVYGDFKSKTPFETNIVFSRPEMPPALPAFSALKGALKRLPDLPAPQAPFALDLSHSPLSEADLKALARFRHLQSLTLIDTGIRDASLKDLSGLDQLQTLILSGNRISDAGVKELAGLTDMKMVSLGRTDIRGTGLKELTGLDKLATLRLFGFHVPDTACKELVGLKQLQVLDLHLSEVTNTGLKELVQLKRLELLNVAATSVTDAGVTEFRKALPDCHVQR
jgi:hypothetical protein